VTELPVKSTNTILKTVPLFAIDESAIMYFPPCYQWDPTAKSICLPTPLCCLPLIVSA
jgi:hypothetical protein